MYAGLQTNRKSFSNLRETCHKTWQVHHCEGCCYLPVDLPTQSRRYLYRTDIFNCIMLSTPANPRPNIITDLYPAHFSKPLTPFEFLVNHASCLTKPCNLTVIPLLPKDPQRLPQRSENNIVTEDN